MSEMQVPLYTSFKSNNMDIIYFEKNYSLPLTMAPAAARTISDFLKDSESAPSDYDLILTGDLGYTGSELLYEKIGRAHV